MKFINWVKRYSKKNNFDFIQLGTSKAPQYRVKNGKRFVDFWINGSYRDIRGNYHRVGAWARGYGEDRVLTADCNYKYDGFLEGIKKEIENLDTTSKE